MAEAPEHAHFCATSMVGFRTEAELREHYRSDFHRYNLKRKVAGLPPVTREWFDARRAKLREAEQVAQAMVYVCPLTSKKFQTENTFKAHTQTKKYKALLADAMRRTNGTFDASPQVFAKPARTNDDGAAGTAAEQGAADADEEAAAEEWDARTCLFTNERFPSVEACLLHMHKRFGFYLPYVDRLTDPEGLLQYLGAKLTEGHIPLYASGLDAEAKRFPSLHAVQRHMVDTNRCRLLFDGNEEEYEDYYALDMETDGSDDGDDDDDEWEEVSDDDEAAALEAEARANGTLALASASSARASSLAPPSVAVSGELVVAGADGASGSAGPRHIGHRAYARYYRQRYKPPETRASVALALVSQRYQQVGIATSHPLGGRFLKGAPASAVEGVASARHRAKQVRNQLRSDFRGEKRDQLPKNVPW